MPEQGEKETYHGYSVDTEDQPQAFGDALTDDRGLEQPLDEGYSPPEKWSAGQRYGNTEAEEARGESLEQRLRQEEPEYSGANAGVGESVRGEVGAARAGRLVEDDAGARTDTDKDMYATDIGIDGAGASAEEAAVHVIEDEVTFPDDQRPVPPPEDDGR
ncbi:MAG: DUF5709 domain-containing protein [Sporichthyaceae bacterium]